MIKPTHRAPWRRLLTLVSLCMGLLSGRPAHAKTAEDGLPSRKNVLGGPLEPCCKKIRAGFFRDGFCRMSASDVGRHVVCAVVTEEFLAFTRAQGNDLSTPHPAAQFPGLKPGDRWCLCASRWRQALQAAQAPKVDLSATDEEALQVVSLQDLQAHDVARP